MAILVVSEPRCSSRSSVRSHQGRRWISHGSTISGQSRSMRTCPSSIGSAQSRRISLSDITNAVLDFPKQFSIRGIPISKKKNSDSNGDHTPLTLPRLRPMKNNLSNESDNYDASSIPQLDGAEDYDPNTIPGSRLPRRVYPTAGSDNEDRQNLPLSPPATPSQTNSLPDSYSSEGDFRDHDSQASSSKTSSAIIPAKRLDEQNDCWQSDTNSFPESGMKPLLLSPPIPSSKCTSPSKSADRFIPSRRFFEEPNNLFRLTKPVDRLTERERICRSSYASPDPFGPLLKLNRTKNSMRGRNQLNISTSAGNMSADQFSDFSPNRRISHGAVWGVGGAGAATEGGTIRVSDGQGGYFGSGTTAPFYSSKFIDSPDPNQELDMYERRLALAFDVDQSERLMWTPSSPSSPISPTRSKANGGSSKSELQYGPRVWRDNEWTRDGMTAVPRKAKKESRPVPTIPFRVLDAPSLRDDFYSSLLAYSHTSHCLAVGLGNNVYLWSETNGVNMPEGLNKICHEQDIHVTSLSFSSKEGGKSILAMGRSSGCMLLWSPMDNNPRFHVQQLHPISCVSFRPCVSRRPSQRDPESIVEVEDLLIGDEIGTVYWYSIEWPDNLTRDLFDWNGAVTNLLQFSVHTQQICGFGWSPEGDHFASGGNDNSCFIFEFELLLQHAREFSERIQMGEFIQAARIPVITNLDSGNTIINDIHRLPRSSPATVPFLLGGPLCKHYWTVSAAVKAIAFCPWQRGLIAIGGGSNDRCIHFYHTISGACLATIDCSAQVTSLIWSLTRREIAATFGFPQPEHSYRIAVFSWPSCEQVVAIPWPEEHRALYAVAFPGGPNVRSRRSSGGANLLIGEEAEEETGGLEARSHARDRGTRANGEGGTWWSRTTQEGCIVVATSDACIKFHEVWSEHPRGSRNGGGGGPRLGLLGGSEILEGLHWVESEGENVIR